MSNEIAEHCSTIGVVTQDAKQRRLRRFCLLWALLLLPPFLDGVAAAPACHVTVRARLWSLL